MTAGEQVLRRDRARSWPKGSIERAMIRAVGETQDRAAITVAPATAERWPDVLKLVGGHRERGCRGRYWRMSSTHYASSRPDGT